MRTLLAGLILSCLVAACGSSKTPVGDPNQNLVPIQQGNYPTTGYTDPGYDSSNYYYNQQQYGADPLASLPPGRYVVGEDSANTVIASISDLNSLCGQIKNQFSQFGPTSGYGAYNSATGAPPVVCDWNGQMCNVVAYLTKNFSLQPRMDPDTYCPY